MYCPYCGVTHDGETLVASIEHVIPYGLGGCDDLTISTCHRANNTLGSTVDAPFMDFFPVRAKRFFLGLESTRGKEPSLDLSGTGWIDGKEVPISCLISADSKELRIAEPQIVRTPNPDGSEHWQVLGDPAQVREIVEGKLRKQLKLGKTMTSLDGKPLGFEHLDALFAENQRVTQNPSVMRALSFDYLVPIRFFSKLALAIGYLHFGEAFARSIVGDLLRQHMSVQTLAQVKLRGAIWPETESVKGILKLIKKENHHVIAIVDGEPPVLLANLFGEFGAFIPLGELAEGRLPNTSAEGTVWRIALPSRELSKLPMSTLIAERSDEIWRSGRDLQ